MDGAAIYATSIGRCIYTPTNITGKTIYDNSIFQVSPPFTFFGNKLSIAAEKMVETLATAPSQLIVTPQVSIYFTGTFLQPRLLVPVRLPSQLAIVY